MRVSTFPTLFGEKAVVRLFVGSGEFRFLSNLGLVPEIQRDLERLLNETGGAILISGPAGSGKTTTLYACLRELLRDDAPRRNIVTLEDPIEAVVEGTAQSQINPTAGFDMETGLRSLMRQDPEVMMLGEIRDRSTAEIAFQAALTGHLVLTTFHAASAAATISRLSDMGIEPYLLRSGVLAIVNQRLVRKLCTCSLPDDNPVNRLGLPVEHHRRAVGCAECRNTGYRGRMVLSEMLIPEPDEIGRGILSCNDTAQLERLAVAAGMVPRWQRAIDAVNAGVTSPSEVRRVLGFSRGDAHE
jgi:type II secretory ATPase GspE/PulE/Tfp pilus assembly ATPase PilB-like protein